MNMILINKLKQELNVKRMNHPTDKIELIIMGTFIISKKFRYNFVKGCYDALNNKNLKLY